MRQSSLCCLEKEPTIPANSSKSRGTAEQRREMRIYSVNHALISKGDRDCKDRTNRREDGENDELAPIRCDRVLEECSSFSEWHLMRRITPWKRRM